MISKIKLLVVATIVAFSGNVAAQNGTNSPYSQYGFGSLADQANGFNKGMSGLGIGYRNGTQVNILNPASYSSIDSLTFIFDVGMSGQITSFEENKVRKNAKNANFDYVVAGFRAFKHLGISFGVIPFSSVGYSFSSTNEVGDANATKYTNTYKGTGGLHQAFLGMGWELFKGFSIGVNGSYLWGDYERSIINSYSDSYVNTLSKYYTANITNYKLDAGAQVAIPLSKNSNLTIGFTYGLGHKLSSNPECKIISTNSQTSVSDTATFKVENGLSLPTTLGGGMMLNLNGKLRLGADYQLQQWGKESFPEYEVVNGHPTYTLKDNYFKDRQKFTIGGEYCRNTASRRFLDRLRIRAGASYTTPYYKINGQDGPKEICVSAGFGIPLMNIWNNRSVLNISGQWVRLDASNLLRENIFRINIGITFNERWFMKWKVD